MNPEIQAALDSVAQQKELCSYLLQKSPHIQEQVSSAAINIYRDQIESPLEFDPRLVEVNVDESTLEKLFSLLSQQWTFCGETRPHHSVLSSDEYLPNNLNEASLRALYDSGASEVALLKKLSERAGIDLNSKRHCFELGCGVGRVTLHLAREFQKVTGADISPGNLRHCAAMMDSQKLQNVQLTQLQHVRDLEKLRDFDVFFSRIVLQHNPPPVQKFILETILKNLAPGGVALFQTVVGGRGYAYSAQSHLARSMTNDFEMHGLPVRYIFEIFQKLNYRVLDVFKELAGGYNVASYTFLAQRD